MKTDPQLLIECEEEGNWQLQAFGLPSRNAVIGITTVQGMLSVEVSRPNLRNFIDALAAYYTATEIRPRKLAPNERGWFQIRVTGYGKFAYWATRKEARVKALEKADWEGGRGFTKRLFDDDPEVLKEIESMRKFFKARGVPYEGSKDPDALRERDAYFSNLPEAREAPKEP